MYTTAKKLITIGTLVAVTATPALAMDTKAAGQCAVLGALYRQYRPKAEAVLTTANRTGYGALVKQRAHEEIDYLAGIKFDKKAQEAWTFTAIRACHRF